MEQNSHDVKRPHLPTTISWDNQQEPKQVRYPGVAHVVRYMWCPRCRTRVEVPCQLCKVRRLLRVGPIPEEPEMADDEPTRPLGQKPGGQPISTKKVKKMRTLRRAGKTLEHIALTVGCCVSTIKKYLAE